MSADEVFALARDFEKASGKVARSLYSTFKAEGEAFAEDWRSNARATSGAHGKHYPGTITSETRVSTDVVVETGPEAGRPQGGMGPGFEFGSRNQPPHLDGARALTGAAMRLDRAAAYAIGEILP